LGIAIQIFGRVILFYFLGEILSKAFGKSRISPLAAVTLGLILVTLIRFIPVIGFLFSFCLSIIGWGVVIKTKFGTTENWFKRS
jgi:sorbitol-specific phosphotransferase system component IIBC